MIYLIDPVKYVNLFPYANPLESEIWGDYVIRPWLILENYERGVGRATSLNNYVGSLDVPDWLRRRQDEQRVSWLMLHGWDDPIDLENQDDHNPTSDGNHRIAAALLLGLDYLEAGFILDRFSSVVVRPRLVGLALLK